VTDASFPHLFAPLTIGPLRLVNRVMQLATTNNLDDHGRVGADLIAFYVERAKGGVGIIVSEGLAAHGARAETPATSLGRGRIAAHSQETLAGLTDLAGAVHEHGVPIIGQIYHGGRQHHSDAVPMLWGPSAVPDPHSGGVPHAMTIDEIRSMITGFADAAAMLRSAGFDGVEVHAAQGHLIQEFFSPFSNVRTDEYGGSFANRIRFVTEVLDAVRRRCGPGFVVGLRMGAEELSPNGIDESMAVEFAEHIAGLGLLDYLSVTVGNFNSIEIHTPDRHHARMEFTHYAAAVRRVVGGLPVVTCGRIVEPAAADELIARGEADLVGLCRPLLADAEWAGKARDGRAEEIRLCISCNQCWGTIIMERPVNCIQNAATGRELSWGIGTLTPVREPKRVVVVGAGPAGLEAARVAAVRGHRVLLLEARDAVGGSVNLAASIPGHEEIRYVVDYLRAAVDRAGVEVRTGVHVDADAVLAESPDAVIVAAGAVPRRDGLGDTGAIPVHTSHDIASRAVDLAGRRVVLFDEDGYYQACEVAELIGSTAASLTLVTQFWEVGREIPATSRVTTLRALDKLGVTLVPTTWFGGVDGPDVVLEHCLSGRLSRVERVDAIVHVGLSASRAELGDALRGRVTELAVIGDAYMPRRIADAVLEGHRAGREV
jgi:2,4-dienoyl-CoA reductase-like NADH-dependent reductase (Old Yellow Enzyme family)